jgi:hypothetical protein
MCVKMLHCVTLMQCVTLQHVSTPIMQECGCMYVTQMYTKIILAL